MRCNHTKVQNASETHLLASKMHHMVITNLLKHYRYEFLNYVNQNII